MPNPDGSETPEEKQARFDKALADQLERNKTAAEKAQGTYKRKVPTETRRDKGRQKKQKDK